MDALIILMAVRKLWIESGYGYKVNELVNRIYYDQRITREQMGKIEKMCQDLIVDYTTLQLRPAKPSFKDKNNEFDFDSSC